MKRKKLFESVIERANGQCEVCGGRGADIHHTIFGNGKRKQHETYESLILLCMNCHHLAHSTELNYKLKKQVQEEYFNQGYSEDEVRKMMGGRLYD